MRAEHTFSRFLRVIEQDEFVAVFHQLHPDPIYFRKEDWKEAARNTQALSRAVVDELIQQGILVESDETDPRELEMYRSSVTKLLNRPSILYLMLAQGCNSACTYCPIPALAERHGNNLLSFDNAIAGIRLWQEHIKDWSDCDPYYLIFYGGEPLLNRLVLEQLLDIVATQRTSGQLPSRFELILPTNGLLVDPALAALLAKHNVLVVLGIDGAPSYNDATRRTTEGEPTSAAVEYASRLLREYGVRLAASMTLTPANVHAADEHRTYFAHLGITRIGFNVLRGIALRASLGTMSTAEYYRAAAKAVVAGYIEEGTGVQEYQLQKKLDALVVGQPFAVDCTCYGSQLVVQADGAVTNCPFLRVDFGHVRSLPRGFRIAETETVRLWRWRIPLLVGDENNSADTSFLHGGGCAWGTFELYGDPARHDDDNELFNLEVMYALIWRRLPRQAREHLLSGEIVHWNHRRLRPL